MTPPLSIDRRSQIFRAVVIFVFTLAGCATPASDEFVDPSVNYYHPFRSGALTLAVVPGLFRIEAKTAAANFSGSSPVSELWAKSAETACKGPDARPPLIKDSSFVNRGYIGRVEPGREADRLLLPLTGAAGLIVPPVQGRGWARTGYALCAGAGTPESEALDTIARLGWPVK